MQGLSQKDLAQLRDGQGLLQAGDGAGALRQLADVAVRTRHPEALHLFAFALLQNSRLDEAQRIIETCLEIAPNHAPYWNSYGSILDEMGFPDQAAAAFEKAGLSTPGYADPWTNLSRIALRFGDLVRADKSIEMALAIDPLKPELLTLAGTIARENRQLDQAANLFRHSLSLNSGDWRTRHNLASTMRELDQSEAALAELDGAIRLGANIAESWTLRGHLLADLGRNDEAIAQYEKVCAVHPGFAEAHEMLAKLLPQMGDTKNALNSFAAALKVEPQNAALLRAALTAAHDVKDHQQLTEWAQLGLRNFGDQPEYWLSLAAAHQHAGEHQTACELLEGRFDNIAAARLFLSHSRLCLHDPKAAEAHALAVTQLAPQNQSGWAHLSVIWRLLGDNRENWLANYERFVMTVDVDLSETLTTTLTQMHSMQTHPAEQSLRGGTQTRGNLFDRRLPEIAVLAQEIRHAIAAKIAHLPDDDAHPFLARKADAIDFSASWSVRLANEGFHINHIHPMGWVSSALYIDLPPKLDKGEGSLTFGVPDAAYGLDLAPRRIEAPSVGKLVLFPSYFWHGTTAFNSNQHRLTVAFDAIPAGER